MRRSGEGGGGDARIIDARGEQSGGGREEWRREEGKGNRAGVVCTGVGRGAAGAAEEWWWREGAVAGRRRSSAGVGEEIVPGGICMGSGCGSEHRRDAGAAEGVRV